MNESLRASIEPSVSPFTMIFNSWPALSPQRQLTLLLEIVNCAKEDSQFIMVTHSPILLGIPGAEILSFDEGQIHPIEYEDTDSYQITKMFIENKEQLLKRLLSV